MAGDIGLGYTYAHLAKIHIHTLCIVYKGIEEIKVM